MCDVRSIEKVIPSCLQAFVAVLSLRRHEGTKPIVFEKSIRRNPFLMVSLRRAILLLLITIWATLNACSQAGADPVSALSSELLKKDFHVFRDSVERLHPGLYRHRDKNDLDSVFDRTYSLLNSGMPVVQFYLLLRNVISNIRDGHTSCNLPSELGSYFMANAKMFPVQLRFINDRAYVPCKQSFFPVASEIMAIDNKSIDEIRERLFSYLPSDGANETKKYGDLNNDSFIPLYFLAFGEKKSFLVEYKTDDGKVKTQIIYADLSENAKCRNTPPKNPKYLELDFKAGKVAVLTIKTFSSHLLESRDQYANFLESSFKQINSKGVSKLVIDLRDNGGGHDVYGSMLYSYLTDKPFEYYTSLETTTRRLQEDDHPNLSTQQPAKNNFRGKVYFLVNGNSFSTTAEFCSIAKSNERGVFIGEETGGGYYGNTSGGNARIVLPNSKIILNIPTTKYTMAVKETKYQAGESFPILSLPRVSPIF